MKVTQKVWIRAEERQEYDPEKGAWTTSLKFTAHELDMTGMAGWIMVSAEPQEITYEVPDNFDFAAGKIKELKKAEENLFAEFERRRTEIQREMNRYLALSAPTTENGMQILDNNEDIPH